MNDKISEILQHELILYPVIFITFLLFLYFFSSRRVLTIDTKKTKGKKLYSKHYSIVAIPDMIEQRGMSTLVVREMKSRGTCAYESDIVQLKATILCVIANYPHRKIIGIVEIAGNVEAYREVFYRNQEKVIYKSIKKYANLMRDIKEHKKSPQSKQSSKNYRKDCLAEVTMGVLKRKKTTVSASDLGAIAYCPMKKYYSVVPNAKKENGNIVRLSPRPSEKKGRAKVTRQSTKHTAKKRKIIRPAKKTKAKKGKGDFLQQAQKKHDKIINKRKRVIKYRSWCIRWLIRLLLLISFLVLCIGNYLHFAGLIK